MTTHAMTMIQHAANAIAITSTCTRSAAAADTLADDIRHLIRFVHEIEKLSSEYDCDMAQRTRRALAKLDSLDAAKWQ